MTAEPELVILVDENGTPTGSVEKFAVHTADTPLHLAFSCHVYNDAGQVLVTRRSLGKLTWPGVWTNSFCGHPAPGEGMEAALARRARIELGITISQITPLLPDFRYRAVDASGIVENEICPVFRAVTTDAVAANPDEVAEWKWVDPASLRSAVAEAPYAFSPWLVMQTAQLSA
ncbi:MAG: isopentenyl-diphosphate Delta-isomerase [Terrimesophilobacter sp.]